MSRRGYRYYSNRRSGTLFIVILIVMMIYLANKRLWQIDLEDIDDMARQYRTPTALILVAAATVWAIGRWWRRKGDRDASIDQSVSEPRISAVRRPNNYKRRPPVSADEYYSPQGEPTTLRSSEQLLKVEPIAFEKITAHVLRFSGYPSVVELGGRTADGGIDLIIDQENAAPIAVQCKKYWREEIGVELLRNFVGAMVDGGYKRGVFVTLKGFTPYARDFAERNHIDLWDHDRIWRVLQENKTDWHAELAELLSTPPRCPNCNGPTTAKRAVRGLTPGKLFWACKAGTPKNWCGSVPFGFERELDGANL